MAIPPGGLIPSGIGGGIYVGTLGDTSKDNADYFDVAGWTLQSIYHNAECTHSGTWGAISRRLVAYDFRFTASVPFDYNEKPPEQLLNDGQSVGIRFDIGDVTQDPLLSQQNGLVQRYYFAPSCLIEEARPVLDATGRDVVREIVTGVGNSIIFLLPDENDAWNAYKGYLQGRGWAV